MFKTTHVFNEALNFSHLQMSLFNNVFRVLTCAQQLGFLPLITIPKLQNLNK